jgi:rod shape-determining protein MreD
MPIAKLRAAKQRDPLFPIIFSVIIASVLMVYPLSYALSGWRPLFMMMVMLFWVLCQPTWSGIWFAFAVGIFTDLQRKIKTKNIGDINYGNEGHFEQNVEP